MKEWKTYCDWLEQKLPIYYSVLNQGIESLSDVEKHCGVSLPTEVHSLYKIHNGDNSTEYEGYAGTFLGFTFLSADMICKKWDSWKDFYGKDIFDGKYIGTSFPDGHIKKLYANPKWIPLFDDSAGNFIGIDLDPDPEGVLGQIINFGRDEDHKIVLSRNAKVM